MTIEERLTALETRVASLEERLSFFRFGTSHDGIRYAMTEGRFGVMTDFWCKLPWGQGAALSIGTEVDRFLLYGEFDKISCPDHPSTGIFTSVEGDNAQRNIAFEAHVKNSAEANIVLYIDGDAFQVSPDRPAVWIGKDKGETLVRLWPQPHKETT